MRNAGAYAKTQYEALTVGNLRDRLGANTVLVDRLGRPDSWQVEEVGDGNLNLVFIIRSPAGSLVVKQALPYARVVGDSWPMSLERTYFEYHAMTRLSARDPGRLPEIYFFDEIQALLVMEYLSPHLILRKNLIAGTVLPELGEHLGLYLARTLFRGSDLSMPTADRKADLALFSANVELSGITEDLFFTDPFHDHPRNRHTPQLNADVIAIRADRDLKLAALRLKTKFCSLAQTLLHGDLHTGSVMVTREDSRVIDAEFAVYGPMGFDIGSLLGNLWMAYFAQPAHQSTDTACASYQNWILKIIERVWTVFATEFAHLWRTERSGILSGKELFEAQDDRLGSEAGLQHVLHEIWQDTLGFAGIEIHRRILGLAHIPEFDSIQDEAKRAACERKALAMGRQLAVYSSSFQTMSAVNQLATIVMAQR